MVDYVEFIQFVVIFYEVLHRLSLKLFSTYDRSVKGAPYVF